MSATLAGAQTAPQHWLAANQALLAAEFLLLRARLGEASLRQDAQAQLDTARAQLSRPAMIDQLATRFGLSPFERQLLLLCAGVEMDGRLGAACKGAPTFALALATLAEPHWSALTPEAPLRRWRLIDVGTDAPLTRASLRCDERLLHALAGIGSVEPRLRHLLRPVEDVPLSATQQALVERAARALVEGRRVQLCGREAALAEDLALAIANELGHRLLWLRDSDLPSAGSERPGMLALLAREAALQPAIVMLDAVALPLDAAAALEVPVLLHEAEALHGRHPPQVETYARPTPAEQRALWRQWLEDRDATVVAALSAQFRFGAREIRDIALSAQQQDTDTPLATRLWQTARRHTPRALDELATRIEPQADWDRLLLPASTLVPLRQLAAQTQHRHRVHEDWGFGSDSARGLGITALFAGDSGTGKTLAAEVIAHTLQLDLYRIDLAGLVSKYIGETEKNLRRVFDAAEDAGAVLLFDEADALFGKRSEVKDSHDRYANLEVSYLLQRMEAYRGLAILTTNLKSALDPAFQRRLRFIVQFPFPDATLRAQLWRQAFPPRAPLGDIDWARLARLQLAGGSIRNVAINAAMLACEAGSDIDMHCVLNAARSEYAKQGRNVDADLRSTA